MSGASGKSSGQSINDMATTVVRTDGDAQTAIEEQEKGTWTDDEKTVLFVPDWSQKAPVAETGWATWQKAAAVIIALAFLGAGTLIGYNLFAGQPAGIASADPDRRSADPACQRYSAAVRDLPTDSAPADSRQPTPVTTPRPARRHRPRRR